ncbi:MAG: hypothetical protein R6W82_07335 [bacterium]
MRCVHTSRGATTTVLLLLLLQTTLSSPARGQVLPDPLAAPLPQETLDLLAEEVSGQMAFNNLVRLAGAPWVREEAELAGESLFYESDLLYRLVRDCGIETVRLEEWDSEGSFDYPLEGEFWVTSPERRLVARIGADAALVARGSQTADFTSPLVYLPARDIDQLRAWLDHRDPDVLRGKAALMWAHPRGEMADLLDESGLRGVVSFSSRDRYLDPDQVVYGSGSYSGNEHLVLGMSVSWRQWSELMEDVGRGVPVEVRMQALVESYPDRYETVIAWIEGTESDAPGVVFTAHLFEGYLKRGTNDNMGGPAIQLEILRTLHTLIRGGALPQPRRTIWFFWPQEISGTYEWFRRNPGLAEKMSCNINMDMVSEGLRINNSWLTMSECPPHLPSYLDGLTASLLNYVWRTNDIVYLGNSPRGRPGGQFFPDPLWEKNGSRDAFRFYIHEATGGSDHLVFNNPLVGVPGIELFTWPDTWYHADTDLPDKADPTEMRRVAFIGAASAVAAAGLTPETLDGMLDAVDRFGHARMAERIIPPAYALLEAASDTAGEGMDLTTALRRAQNLVDAGIIRERGAVASIEEIAPADAASRSLIRRRRRQWEIHGEELKDALFRYARLKAETSDTPVPDRPEPAEEEMRWSSVVPSYHPDVAGRYFSTRQHPQVQEYLQSHREELEETGLDRSQMRAVDDFINGERSVTEIRGRVAALTDSWPGVEHIAAYLEVLEAAGWVVLER